MLTSLLKRTALTAVALAALSTAAFAQLAELKIMAPAAPGGGWQSGIDISGAQQGRTNFYSVAALSQVDRDFCGTGRQKSDE